MDVGFVYIWRDRSRRMFYIGSHWGAPDDGYVCSSRDMLAEWRCRPHDFRRRILAVVIDRKAMLKEENRWLAMVDRKQARRNAYYNQVLTINDWVGTNGAIRRRWAHMTAAERKAYCEERDLRRAGQPELTRNGKPRRRRRSRLSMGGGHAT